MNRRISTSSHRQIHCNHPDLVAVKLWTAEIQYLIFSVYIPPLDVHRTADTTPAESMLDEIQNCIEQHSQRTERTTRLILAGDFNRHHPAWSHRPVNHAFTAQAGELVNFFQTYRLQWCLPRGEPTYWSPSRPGKTSVLDLTLPTTPQNLLSANSTITTTDQTTGEPIQNGTSSQTTIKPLILSERMIEPTGLRSARN